MKESLKKTFLIHTTSNLIENDRTGENAARFSDRGGRQIIRWHLRSVL